MHFILLFTDPVEEAEGDGGQDGAHGGNGQYGFQDVFFMVMVFLLTHL